MSVASVPRAQMACHTIHRASRREARRQRQARKEKNGMQTGCEEKGEACTGREEKRAMVVERKGVHPGKGDISRPQERGQYRAVARPLDGEHTVARRWQQVPGCAYRWRRPGPCRPGNYSASLLWRSSRQSLMGLAVRILLLRKLVVFVMAANAVCAGMSAVAWQVQLIRMEEIAGRQWEVDPVKPRGATDHSRT
ncbi:hypothetical protein BD309DRAFT_564733 [Dichomitus squalens]|nr:hypothetical protein BD309DRAFT_564733 [Dichomitus squalens]